MKAQAAPLRRAARPDEPFEGARLPLLELKNLHVALEDGTEIVKGVDLARRHERGARDHGPERVGQVDALLRDRGPSGLRGDRGPDPPRRRGHHRGRPPTSARSAGSSWRSSTRRRSRACASPTSCAPRSTRSARRQAGGERRPDPGAGVPRRAVQADGPAQGLARARLALPERRVLGRREEAGRDPADGDAEAAHGGARRDRLGPRHRRAQGRRRRREGARQPGDGRARDHALQADPQLHRARPRPRLRRRADRRVRRPGARG